MPRFPRNYLKTTYFHVITQGINKSYIFDKDENKKYYIKSMYELANCSNVKIVAYCIMDNHAHILIKVNDIGSLSKYMQRLNTKYGKYYNKQYKRVGYVFRDRYKSEGIFSEKQLYNCINYIYNNPVKAKICDNPEKYLYSNYKKIYDKTIDEGYLFIDVDEKNIDDKIDKILLANKVDIEKIGEDKEKLKKIITELKNDKGISLRKIAEKLNINREIVRRIFNE